MDLTTTTTNTTSNIEPIQWQGNEIVFQSHPISYWPAVMEEYKKMRPFMYAIVKNPTPKQAEEGAGPYLLANGVLLAKDENQARSFAGMKIKDEDMGAADRIDVYVRSF